MQTEIYGSSPISLGRAVIPREARKHLNIKDGDRVVFAKLDKHVVILNAKPELQPQGSC